MQALIPICITCRVKGKGILICCFISKRGNHVFQIFQIGSWGTKIFLNDKYELVWSPFSAVAHLNQNQKSCGTLKLVNLGFLKYMFVFLLEVNRRFYCCLLRWYTFSSDIIFSIKQNYCFNLLLYLATPVAASATVSNYIFMQKSINYFDLFSYTLYVMLVTKVIDFFLCVFSNLAINFVKHCFVTINSSPATNFP